MKLRIYRTWLWKQTMPARDIPLGPASAMIPYELVAHEMLQYQADDGTWQPVEIVEGEIPRHPSVLAAETRAAETRALVDRFVASGALDGIVSRLGQPMASDPVEP